ncbi:transposase [Escherichia coli]|nr:transposase [Escherichia coli]
MGTKVSDMQKNVTPGRRKGCPNYPPEFKQQLVAASCEPGISISKLALENGINANLLFKWRQQWREGKLLLPSSESPQLLPVTLDAAAEQPESLAEDRKRAARTVLTGMCYSVGSATRQGSSSPTRFIGQSAMTSRT